MWEQRSSLTDWASCICSWQCWLRCTDARVSVTLLQTVRSHVWETLKRLIQVWHSSKKLHIFRTCCWTSWIYSARNRWLDEKRITFTVTILKKFKWKRETEKLFSKIKRRKIIFPQFFFINHQRSVHSRLPFSLSCNVGWFVWLLLYTYMIHFPHFIKLDILT